MEYNSINILLGILIIVLFIIFVRVKPKEKITRRYSQEFLVANLAKISNADLNKFQNTNNISYDETGRAYQIPVWDLEYVFRENIEEKLRELEGYYKNNRNMITGNGFDFKSVYKPMERLKSEIIQMCNDHTAKYGYCDYDISNMPQLHRPYMTDAESREMANWGQWNFKDQKDYNNYQKNYNHNYPVQNPQCYDADGYEINGHVVDWNNLDEEYYEYTYGNNGESQKLLND